jgi:hypothetical protein
LHGRDTRFLVAWTLTVLLFYSVARSKLPGYVVPAFPPAALLFGAWADRAGSAREATGAVHATLGFVALLGVLLLASGLLLPSIVERYLGDVACPTPSELSNLRSAAFSGGLAAVIGSLWSLHGLTTRSITRVTSELAGVFVLVLVSLLTGRDLASTSRGLATAIAHEASPGDVVAQDGTLMQGLSFYLRRRVIQIGDAGEIARGAARASDRDDFFWADTERLAKEWRSDRRIYVAMNRPQLAEAMDRLVPTPRLVVQCGRRVVLSNGPRE